LGAFDELGTTAKKAHEVPRMAAAVRRAAAESGATCVMDVGSGKGHVAQELAVSAGLRVIAVDSNPANAAGALHRHQLLARRRRRRSARGRGGRGTRISNAASA
jgi:ubiquinone/menaquinone biosynthesis C-methylase UbiE